jgi:D-alanine-D-alanine ligase
MQDINEIFSDIEIRKMKNDLSVGVIAGGMSSEREVSLKTGRNILESLIRSGYNAYFLDPGSNDFIEKIKNIDVAFMALHGKLGEDGTVQGMLELLRIPYTGSGVLSSALVMDKILSKQIMISKDIPTPEYIEISMEGNGHSEDEIDRDIIEKIGYPVMVKPNTGGSTIGINLIKNRKFLKEGIEIASRYDRKILIEKYIIGRELTVGIIGRNPVPLPIIEIKPGHSFYDYKSKYTENMTRYLIPAPLKKELTEEILDISLKCHTIFDCYGISRVDLILDNNLPYVLEVNTMPGMTETSLVPKAADSAGIKFDHLVEIILDTADIKIN